jgi:biopolymer transport protein ExbD
MASSTETEDGVVTGINVTPLVDIMLVLLIVFMVTAHFVQDSGLKVNLPKAASTETTTATAALTVTMDGKGALRLMENDVDLNGLKANLEREAKANPGIRVTLAADEELPYKQIVAALDTIKQAGVTRVALATQK